MIASEINFAPNSFKLLFLVILYITSYDIFKFKLFKFINLKRANEICFAPSGFK
jgi:hypothetical protein